MFSKVFHIYTRTHTKQIIVEKEFQKLKRFKILLNNIKLFFANCHIQGSL